MTDIERKSSAVRAHCEAVGYRFKPWEPCPWETDTPDPPGWARGTAWARNWPRIFRLRLVILDEIFGPRARKLSDGVVKTVSKNCD